MFQTLSTPLYQYISVILIIYMIIINKNINYKEINNISLFIFIIFLFILFNQLNLLESFDTPISTNIHHDDNINNYPISKELSNLEQPGLKNDCICNKPQPINPPNNPQLINPPNNSQLMNPPNNSQLMNPNNNLQPINPPNNSQLMNSPNNSQLMNPNNNPQLMNPNNNSQLMNPNNQQPINVINNQQPIDIPNNFNDLTKLITTIFDDKINKILNNYYDKNDQGDYYNNGLKKKDAIIQEVIAENNAITCNCEDIANKAISKFLKNRRLIDNRGMLHYADQSFGDMGYSQLKLDNYIPMGSSGNGVYDTWDNVQYNIISTDRWKQSDINTKKCNNKVIYNPQPMESKTPLNLMNWDNSRIFSGPENINVKYINDKLNNNSYLDQ